MPAPVLIVDDNPRFRRRARRWLEEVGYEVVGEAGDGTAALEAARRHQPAIILLDIQLPDTSGLALVERLVDEAPEAAVVLTSTREAADFGDRISRCGARGFLPKAELSGERLSALLS